MSAALTVQKALRLREEARALLRDPALPALLSSLDRAIGETRRVMAETGMTRVCADCSSAGDAGCCVRRVSYDCDSVILLINLLLGVSLPLRSGDRDACHFLTEAGCSLRARPVICINYLCSRLRDSIHREGLLLFQEAAGREMDSLFSTEEHIKRRLQGRGLSSP